MALALYFASILGAISLILIMPKRGIQLPLIGGVLGAATLGGLWLFLGQLLPANLGVEPGVMPFYYIFSALAIVAGVRVITHTRPVYAALWFVMVVLSSAGLFLTLDAQFIAFAMVIIYGGAILVTYMFVIMLAAQPTVDDAPQSQPEFERWAREPVLAVTAGFFLLSLLLNVMFQYHQIPPTSKQAMGLSNQQITQGWTANGMSHPPILGRRADLRKSQAAALKAAGFNPNGNNLGNSLGTGNRVTDIERVGLDLFRGHPLGIELAGVILLVSLVGAVVIAKTHVEDEDEVISPEQHLADRAASREQAGAETLTSAS